LIVVDPSLWVEVLREVALFSHNVSVFRGCAVGKYNNGGKG